MYEPEDSKKEPISPLILGKRNIDHEEMLSSSTTAQESCEVSSQFSGNRQDASIPSLKRYNRSMNDIIKVEVNVVGKNIASLVKIARKKELNRRALKLKADKKKNLLKMRREVQKKCNRDDHVL